VPTAYSLPPSESAVAKSRGPMPCVAKRGSWFHRADSCPMIGIDFRHVEKIADFTADTADNALALVKRRVIPAGRACFPYSEGAGNRRDVVFGTGCNSPRPGRSYCPGDHR